MIWLLFSMLVACGAAEKPANVHPKYPAPSKSPKEIAYSPRTRLSFKSPMEIIEGQEPIADELSLYIEKSFNVRRFSLNHGYIPRRYIAGASQLEGQEWSDRTLGKVPDMHKLDTVLARIDKRCPGTTAMLLPYKVDWRNAWASHPTLTGFYRTGLAPMYYVKDGEVTVVRPQGFLSSIHVFATRFDRDGNEVLAKSYREVNGHEIWEARDGDEFVARPVDATFAHELGHHYFTSWAVNNGFHSYHSMYFGELMADMFSQLCYGGYHEAPVGRLRKRQDLDRLRKFCPVWKDNESCRELQEFPYNIETSPPNYYPIYNDNQIYQLISGEIFRGRYSPLAIWHSAIETWRNMTGEKTGCDPKKEGSDEEKCSWQFEQDGISNQEENKPLVFSKREFFRRFCDHYPCEEGARKLFKQAALHYTENFVEW